jgi:hypothetical protein
MMAWKFLLISYMPTDPVAQQAGSVKCLPVKIAVNDMTKFIRLEKKPKKKGETI